MTENLLTKKQKMIKETKSIILIIIAVLTFRSVFFEPFRIPSGSMIPTLMIGDFILVNKFAYGFKVPFTDLVLGEKSFNPIYIAGKSDPKRGDVVVFKYPKDLSVNYIKRV
ncbi:MAG: signal peptidase I, partial [Bacteriovorax sp.]